MGKIFLLVVLLLSLPAFAQSRKPRHLKTAEEFDQLDNTKLDPKRIYYSDNSESILRFPDWSTRFPEQAAALSLYPGYKEPMVTDVVEGKAQQPRQEHMFMFISRTKMVLNKPAATIPLEKMVTFDKVSHFDDEFHTKMIAPNEVLAEVVKKKQPVHNFEFCNGRLLGPIARPMNEVDLNYTLPPQNEHQWCSDPNHSVCVEACYIFDAGTYADVILANRVKKIKGEPLTDAGMAFQSEIRYIPGQDYNIPAKPLTGVDEPLVGVIEQNIFYINQGIEYAKAVSLVQEYPGDKSKTLLTTLYTIAIKEKEFKTTVLRLTLMGKNPATYQPHGVMSGFPDYTKEIMNKIGDIMEGTVH